MVSPSSRVSKWRWVPFWYHVSKASLEHFGVAVWQRSSSAKKGMKYTIYGQGGASISCQRGYTTLHSPLWSYDEVPGDWPTPFRIIRFAAVKATNISGKELYHPSSDTFWLRLIKTDHWSSPQMSKNLPFESPKRDTADRRSHLI